MFGNRLLKWGCLAFVMLFGLIFTLEVEDVDASSFAVTADGCRWISGDLNNAMIYEVGFTNAGGCDNINLQDNIDTADIDFVNPSSSVVVNNPGVTYTGTALGSFTVIGFHPLIPDIYHSVLTPNYCKDFYGRTNDNPNRNQGVIDFDNVAPEGDFRPCLELSSGVFPAGELHYDIDGWAWNTNLGWVSMMAEDLGSGPENRGLSVGSQEFRSQVKVGSTYRGEGEFFGYWWNDAAGWIKLNCASDGALNAGDPDQCGTVNYQVYIDSFDPVSNRAVLAGYAWSDSFGYIDFTGVEISVPGLSTMYDARITYEKVNPNSEVYANGENGYIIKVSFYNGATNVTKDIADSRFRNSFCLEYEDNRVLDALSETPSKVLSNFGTTPLYTCGSLAVDRSTVNDLNMNQLGWSSVSGAGLMEGNPNRFAYNSTQNAFVMRSDIANNNVKSLVPVDSRDELKVVGVRMFNDLTGLTKRDDNVRVDSEMIFKNPYDLKIVGSQKVAAASCVDGAIELEFDSPVLASICGDYYRGNIASDLRASILGEPSVNPLYADRFDSITALDSDTGQLFENALVSQRGYGAKDIDIVLNLAQGVSAAALNPLKGLMNLEVSSSVSYTVDGQTVRREGPKVQNESQNIFELNIQGGLADRSFGSSTFSSGAKDTQGVNKGLEVKERVYRVLRNILQMDPKPGKCGSIHFEKFGAKFSSDNSFVRETLPELLPDCGRVSKSGGRHVVFIGAAQSEKSYVAYSELKTLIEREFSDEGKAPVVVIYGADLVIDEDVIPQSVVDVLNKGGDVTDLGTGVDQVPGFVVIKTEDSGYGGDVIVSANVTDVVSYIYADGRMMSAPSLRVAVNAAQGDADIVLNRSLLDEEALFNQFSLLGALYSTNCIGCASSVPPLRADGSVSETRQLSLIEDLNAFRYTPLSFNVTSKDVKVPERDDFGVPIKDEQGNVVYKTETYSCLVSCNEDATSFEPLMQNGNLKNECINVESKINATNACFDTERYTLNQNKLSNIEESIAGLSSPSGNSGIKQYDLVGSQNLDESSIRSVNIRSLEIPEGMPVFGVISR